MRVSATVEKTAKMTIVGFGVQKLPSVFRLTLPFLCLLSVGIQNVYAKEYIISGRVQIKDKDGALIEDHSNNVVFVKEARYSQKILSNENSIAQIDKTFSPKVLPIVVGSSVEFPNKDVIFHNVFSPSKPNKFDLGVYKKGKSKSFTFKHIGHVKVYCNLHSGMYADVLVLQNPFYGVTDKNGNFEIKIEKNGDYELVAWQRFGSEEHIKISVKNSQTQIPDIELKQGRVSHKAQEQMGSGLQVKVLKLLQIF